MYGVTVNGELVIRAGVPTLEQLQEAVGGLIETLGRVPARRAGLVEIDVYVNEEGMIFDLPTQLGTWINRYDQPVFGEIVITGADSHGETVALTEAEIRSTFDEYFSRIY